MAESKTSKRRLTAAKRKVRALEMRQEGKTFQHIAQELGYRGPSGAYNAVMTALRETLQEPADELRKVEGERLNKLLEAAWDKATQPTKGKDGSFLWAMDRVLNIMERRAKLFGLDAPTGQGSHVEESVKDFRAGWEAMESLYEAKKKAEEKA